MSEALLKSIERWERMYADARDCGERPGGRDCALCNETRSHPDSVSRCRLCVIFKATGQIACRGTPYDAARSSWNSYVVNGLDEYEVQWQQDSFAMIRYLKSLLPKDVDVGVKAIHSKEEAQDYVNRGCKDCREKRRAEVAHILDTVTLGAMPQGAWFREDGVLCMKTVGNDVDKASVRIVTIGGSSAYMNASVQVMPVNVRVVADDTK